MSTSVRTRADRAAAATAASGRHRSGRPGEGVLASWQAQPLSMRLLRAFLGVTFVYAGIQKLADPNFLHVGTPDYVGSQLKAFSLGSPIAGLLRVLGHAPLLIGIGIALAEIAIGLGTLIGLAPIAFAVGGFLVNLTLTLSATWHVHPYFLGSDSMYAVGWLAYLAGLWELELRHRRALVSHKKARAAATDGLGRREFLRGGVLAGLTLLAGGVAKALGGFPPPAMARPRTHGHSAPAPSADPGPAVQGTEIASLDSLPIGQAVSFQAPGVGSAVLVRLSQDRVEAYSRVCTHAGCLVGYDPSSRVLVCPCHGAEFDPAHGAAVIAGPAPTPLPPVDVMVDRANGTVILPH